MTKREMFSAIVALDEVQANQEMVDFLNREIEILDNRRNAKSSKPTAKQVENEGLKTQILEYLDEAGKATCGEIAKALEITGQRCSALLRQLGADGTKQVTKTMEKKVAYFSLASAE